MFEHAPVEDISKGQLSKQICREDMIVCVSADFHHFIIFTKIINFPTFLRFPKISIHCTRVKVPPTVYRQ